MDCGVVLDGVVTVVDGANLPAYLSCSRTATDVKLQIAYADRILLNKCDLITDIEVCK